MDEENVFEMVSSGAGLTYPVLASALQKNSHVVLRGRPCKIVDMTTYKKEKPKVMIVAIDIFTGKKLEGDFFETNTVEIPNVNRKEYVLTNVDEGFLILKDGDKNVKNYIKLPEGEIGSQIEEAFEVSEGDVLVTVVSAMGEEHAMAVRQSVK